jgi:protein TonB
VSANQSRPLSDFRVKDSPVNYAQAHRNPGKHLTGIGTVIVLHLVLGWALASGLARKVVEVIKAPIETKIIEEVKPPPPPETPPPPPPKMALPPPSFVPPPEIPVANPPPAPAITVQTQTPPPAAPVTISPPAGAGVAAAPAARPAVIDVSTCDKPSYPAAASRAEATGTTKIRFTVDAAGHVDASKTVIERSSGGSREHKLLDRTAVEALSKCKFKPGTDEAGRPVGAFSIVDYVWNLE